MEKPASNGQSVVPTVPEYPADLFAGTARYYAHYRLPYRQELINDLRTAAQLTGRGRLLDLACGTGEVALRMHRFFSEVWAVDQEREMVEVGQEKAEEIGATNVIWMIGRAEDVEAPPGSFELITIGSAFHRLNRQLIAERALQWLAPGCCLAEIGCNVAWRGKEEWQHIIAEIVAKWTCKSITPNAFARVVPPRHEDVLSAAGFKNIENRRFRTAHVWTLDSLVGYLYSTSKASRAVLGDHVEELESEIRRALLQYDPCGQYSETVDFYYILARRPQLRA